MPLPATDEDNKPEFSTCVSVKERRKQLRREASKRYYNSNPGVKEQKRITKAERQAAKKAAKRRWDPPKRPKRLSRCVNCFRGCKMSGVRGLNRNARQDPGHVSVSEHEDIDSGDNLETGKGSYSDELRAQDEYEMHMEKAADTTMEDTTDYVNEESDEASDSLFEDTVHAPSEMRAEDETLVAETLAAMSGLIGLRENSSTMKASTQPSSEEDGGDWSGDGLADSGAEMSRCSSLEVEQEARVRSEPAITVTLEEEPIPKNKA
ncbi:hypothetical protein B0H17DRAFT_1140848 [Mycena rosella]|uniref:Uncharacterized protein n=1 Tax=Mycena rosella TaxID=1033263 RepID=A0AAD7G782_MYCRO|nr:hypothetical protein B0H17DRAFT_1140848 [Mycena rosella]